MNRLSFFSISGLACAAHTPETKEIWQSWGENKSERGRKAVVEYAETLGFNCRGECDDLNVVKEAFNYLIDQFPGNIKVSKSDVLREAIIHYS